MSIKEGAITFFRGVGGVSTLVSSRGFGAKAPQGALRPYFLVTLVSDIDQKILRGYGGLTRALLRVTAVGDTEDQAHDLGDALYTAIGKNGQSNLTWDGLTMVVARWEDGSDLPTIAPQVGDDAGVHQVTRMLSVWYRRA